MPFSSLQRGKKDANKSEKGLLKKAIPHFTAILSIGANDKCNIDQKPACLSLAKPDEFAGFRYET
ncbi:MAG: hypothetical protein J0L62_11150 [Bacteroidetes bacterium]|nr:hypothetical protein [Bacteroidota bacterium]